MRILPVLDVQGGRAVLAVAGDRPAYRPLLASRFAPGSSDPLALARGLRDAGATELYLADLDAIALGAGPSLGLIGEMIALGLVPWVDAGVAAGGPTVARLAELGAGVVVGLESGAGPGELATIVARLGPGRVAWSLDLRAGIPIVPKDSGWRGDRRDPANLAAQAIAAGVRRVIRLDLARVGTGSGVDHFPAVDPAGAVEWWAGGGVRGPGDLAQLAGRGYAAALVGSALHDGRVGLGEGPAAGLSGHRTS